MNNNKKTTTASEGISLKTYRNGCAPYGIWFESQQLLAFHYLTFYHVHFL